MCGAPVQDLSLEGIDVAAETIIQGTVSRGGEPAGGAYVRLLDSTGEFTAEVVTSAGREALDQAARAWIIGHWRYRPALRDGNPAVTQVLASVTYSLKNQP